MTDEFEDYLEETQTSEERDQRIAYYEMLLKRRDTLIHRYELGAPVNLLKEAHELDEEISAALELAGRRVVDPDVWGEYRALQRKCDEAHDRKVQK